MAIQNEIQTTGTTAVSATRSLTREQVDLIKRTCAKEATDDELSLFIAYCNNKGVNPLSKEIYFTKYNGQVNFLVSYHFMLAKVQETGLFEGMTLPLFCGEDGNWKELWTTKTLPVACKVGIFRKGYREAVYSIRYMEETQQSNPQWKKQPLQMLRKATIADALRLTFDDILRGMYTIDEMPTAQFEPTLSPAAPRPTTPWNNKQPLVGEDKDCLSVEESQGTD